MTGDFPVFKRCCMCLPLRYGLLAWGYLKLIYGLFLIVGISCSIYSHITTPTPPSEDETDETSSQIDAKLILVIIRAIVLLTDFVLTMTFIIGGHMKNVKILRIYYFYSIAIWVLILVLSTLMLATAINFWMTSDDVIMRFWMDRFFAIPDYFGSFVIQTYFLILLRSEIIKLRNNFQFRFVNNAAESELISKYGEEVEAGEKRIEETEEKGTYESNDTSELRGTVNV